MLIAYFFDELVKSGWLIPTIIIIFIMFFVEDLKEDVIILLGIIWNLSILIVPPLILFWHMNNSELERSIWIKEVKNIIFDSSKSYVIKNTEERFKKNIHVVPSYKGTVILKARKGDIYKITVSGCNIRRSFFSKDKICVSGVHIEDGRQFFYNKNLYNSYSFRFPTAPMDKAVLIVKKGKENEKILVGQKPTIVRFKKNSGEVRLSLNSPDNASKFTGLGWEVYVEKVKL